MSNEAKCPFAGGTRPHAALHRRRDQRRLVAEPLNLEILHQHSPRVQPDGRDFDYAQGVHRRSTSMPWSRTCTR